MPDTTNNQNVGRKKGRQTTKTVVPKLIQAGHQRNLKHNHGAKHQRCPGMNRVMSGTEGER